MKIFKRNKNYVQSPKFANTVSETKLTERQRKKHKISPTAELLLIGDDVVKNSKHLLVDLNFAVSDIVQLVFVHPGAVLHCTGHRQRRIEVQRVELEGLHTIKK